MDYQGQLQEEVDQYNDGVNRIQELSNTLSELQQEQNRRLGRIGLLEEILGEELKKASQGDEID